MEKQDWRFNVFNFDKKKLDISEMGRINIIIVSIIINIFEDLGLNKVKFKWPNDIFINKKKNCWNFD